MKELVCITCPNGCLLQIEELANGELAVSGNRCKRGETFAVNELKHPMRTICSTVRTTNPHVPVLPVRLSAEIPKEKIFDVMKAINRVVVEKPVAAGEVVISHVLGLDADVIVTSNILQGDWKNECKTI